MSGSAAGSIRTLRRRIRLARRPWWATWKRLWLLTKSAEIALGSVPHAALLWRPTEHALGCRLVVALFGSTRGGWGYVALSCAMAAVSSGAGLFQVRGQRVRD